MRKAREAENFGLEEEADGEIIAEPMEGVSPVAGASEGVGVFPARVQEQGAAGGRSLQEELQEVQQGGRREDDYVAQEEVEEYLELIKQEGENYVDEAQVKWVTAWCAVYLALCTLGHFVRSLTFFILRTSKECSLSSYSLIKSSLGMKSSF